MLRVKLVPAIAKIIAESNSTLSKAVTFIVLQSPKMQDPNATYLSQKETIKMEKDEEEKKENDHKKEVKEMTHTLFYLKQKIDEFQSIKHENESNSKKLAKLYDLRIINEYGDPTDQFKNMS